MHLTNAQYTTLANAIRASADPEVVAALAIRNDNGLAALYNADSTVVVYKTSVTVDEIGKAFDWAGVEALTTANNERLQTFRNFVTTTMDPRRADLRSFFDNVFSVAAGATTRTKLAALWKRTATKFEALYTTGPGAGTTADPAALVVEGTLTSTEVGYALNNF